MKLKSYTKANVFSFAEAVSPIGLHSDRLGAALTIVASRLMWLIWLVG